MVTTHRSSLVLCSYPEFCGVVKLWKQHNNNECIRYENEYLTYLLNNDKIDYSLAMGEGLSCSTLEHLRQSLNPSGPHCSQYTCASAILQASHSGTRGLGV